MPPRRTVEGTPPSAGPTNDDNADVLNPLAGSFAGAKGPQTPSLPPIEVPMTAIGSASQTSGHSGPWPAWILGFTDLLSLATGLSGTQTTPAQTVPVT